MGNKEVIVEEYFDGKLRYSNSGMRHEDEVETFYLKKGDRVIIERYVKKKKKK